MGALTLKTFPFELRGWELEKFNTIDLTDSFGLNVKISLNNKQIVQIEPGNSSKSIWINDKARQYFDSFYLNKKPNVNLVYTVKHLSKIVYLFELCSFKTSFTNYFLIVYEQLSFDDLSLLISISKKFWFIKLKEAKNSLVNTNLESNFLFNQKVNLNESAMSLTVSTNLRFENSMLNLNLKQRMLKNSFKMFFVGSFVNLTHNVKFLGSSSSRFLKSLIQGTHLVCQDIKLSKNPLVFVNSDILKLNNFDKSFVFLNKINSGKISLNVLHSTLFETSAYFLNKPTKLTGKDFINFSCFYCINLTNSSFKIINKIMQTAPMYLNKTATPYIKNICLNQNIYNQKIYFKNVFKNNLLTNYLHLPTKSFFELRAKFINNKGLIKITNKLNLANNAKSSWKIIRNTLNLFKKTNKKLISTKSNLILTSNFKNNIIKTVNCLNNQTNNNLNPNFEKTPTNHSNNFLIIKGSLKNKKIKFLNNKVKLWLNDFFLGGNDGLARNSVTMAKSSKINKFNSTNFTHI